MVRSDGDGDLQKIDCLRCEWRSVAEGGEVAAPAEGSCSACNKIANGAAQFWAAGGHLQGTPNDDPPHAHLDHRGGAKSDFGEDIVVAQKRPVNRDGKSGEGIEAEGDAGWIWGNADSSHARLAGPGCVVRSAGQIMQVASVPCHGSCSCE